MDKMVKNIVKEIKEVSAKRSNLEDLLVNYSHVETNDHEKDLTNFGNLSIAVHGYKMVETALRCIVLNEGFIEDNDGEFYEKIDVDDDDDEETSTDASGDPKDE
jgi:hypothetical protein